MQRALVFAGGLVIGVAGGVAGTRWFTATQSQTDAGLGGGVAAAPTPSTAPTPLPDLPTSTSTVPPNANPSNPAPAPPPRPDTPDEATTRAALNEAARAAAKTPPENAAVQAWRDRGRSLADWDPTDPKYDAILRDALVALRGPDAALADAAGYALAFAGTQQRFSPAQRQQLRDAFPDLVAAGDPDSGLYTEHYYGRSLELDPPIEHTTPAAWVAWMLAYGTGDETEVQELMRRVPLDAYPAIHLAVLGAWAHRVSDAHRDYVLALTGQARNGSVCVAAWDLNRIDRLVNRAWAPRLVDAVARRVEADGGSAHSRWVAWQAAAVAAVHVPDHARPILQAAADREADTGVAAFLRAVAEGLEDGSLNRAAVGVLATRHTPANR